MDGDMTGGWWNLFPDQSGQGAATPSATGATPQQNLLSQVTAKGGPIVDILGGTMDVIGGFQQQRQDESQAQRFRQESWLDLYNAGREVQAQGQKGVAMESEAAASAGAGNVTVSGSVTNAMHQTTNRVMEANAASRYAGQVKHLEDQYEANQMVWAGKQAMWGGLMGGLMGFTKAGADFLNVGG